MSTGNSHRLAIAGVLLVLVAGLALVTAPIGSADQSQLPVSRCGIVNGATWKYHGRSGNHYAVLAGGTASCPAARASVTRLTRDRHTSFTPLAGAPPGFLCVASPIADPRLAARAVAPLAPAAGSAIDGACNARNHSGFFTWAAVS